MCNKVLTFSQRACDNSGQFIIFFLRWYNKHLKEFGKDDQDDRISIVLLTNDMKNKERAMEEGIEVYTGILYIKASHFLEST